jgi:hypothetical protein
MRYLRYQCLTAVLLCLVVLVYVGGINSLRRVYDALRHTRIRGVC